LKTKKLWVDVHEVWEIGGLWICHFITNRVSMGGNAIACIHLSVHLFPLYLSNRLTFDLDLLHVCVGHCHGWQGLKLKVTGQGHRGQLIGIDDRTDWDCWSTLGSLGKI